MTLRLISQSFHKFKHWPQQQQQSFVWFQRLFSVIRKSHENLYPHGIQRNISFSGWNNSLACFTSQSKLSQFYPVLRYNFQSKQLETRILVTVIWDKSRKTWACKLEVRKQTTIAIVLFTVVPIFIHRGTRDKTRIDRIGALLRWESREQGERVQGCKPPRMLYIAQDVPEWPDASLLHCFLYPREKKSRKETSISLYSRR